ncbi:putative intracellular septation protein A [Aquimixticola soesokkakensis]|uniref:Inner membrane-spanning protein YciB n=1 Tax=Aquimixticola soesokkakensis TaxID=1519096 RepID=A0A1Y5S2S1_9RHOB|nr:inner membrane-spanning protein YciB [Aquimixticola soesokkakensis]SLN31292.1 putative intracellular septation protein A [Aquimixticola soesokkakensis]
MDKKPAQKHVSPGVKTALELGPILLFFVAYIALKDKTFSFAGQEYSGFIVATAAFIPLIALSSFALWRLSGKLSAMQIMTLVLVTVFGGLSVYLNDDRFFKMKPTIIYLFFAILLGVGVLRKESWLKSVMGEMVPLTPAGWHILTLRFIALFVGLAVANEIVWRTMDTDTWVKFKTFGLPIVMFAFIMAQSRLFARHADETVADKPD